MRLIGSMFPLTGRVTTQSKNAGFTGLRQLDRWHAMIALLLAQDARKALSEAFLTHRSSSAPAVAMDRLEPVLRAAFDEAKRARPESEVEAQELAGRLGELLAEAADPISALAEVRVDDVFLCLGCSRGHPASLAVFERSILSSLDPAIGRTGAPEAVIDEVKQRVREKLLVDTPDRPAKITAYSGRGSLRSWVRVVAVREALALRAGQRAPVPAEDEAIGAALGVDRDPELGFLKGTYRAEFKRAFAEALGSLQTRDRTLLRLQHVERLTLDQTASVFGVHRATIARWNQRVREALLVGTRQGLMRSLRVDPTELESIMRMIHSNLEVSVQRLLRPEPELEGDES